MVAQVVHRGENRMGEQNAVIENATEASAPPTNVQPHENGSAPIDTRYRLVDALCTDNYLLRLKPPVCDWLWPQMARPLEPSLRAWDF